MTQIISTPLANQIATLIANVFADGFLDFYDSDPNTGNLLAELKLPIAPFTAPSGGVIALAGQWFGTTILAGTTTYARFRDSTSTYYLDVTVGTESAQVMLSHTVLTLGAVLSVTAFTYTVPTS
jgi:hypothetical protein